MQQQLVLAQARVLARPTVSSTARLRTCRSVARRGAALARSTRPAAAKSSRPLTALRARPRSHDARVTSVRVRPSGSTRPIVSSAARRTAVSRPPRPCCPGDAHAPPPLRVRGASACARGATASPSPFPRHAEQRRDLRHRSVVHVVSATTCACRRGNACTFDQNSSCSGASSIASGRASVPRHATRLCPLRRRQCDAAPFVTTRDPRGLVLDVVPAACNAPNASWVRSSATFQSPVAPPRA